MPWSRKAGTRAYRLSSREEAFITFLGRSCKEVNNTTCKLTLTMPNGNFPIINRLWSITQRYHYTLSCESRANGLPRSPRSQIHAHKPILVLGEPRRMLRISSSCARSHWGISKCHRHDQHTACCCTSIRPAFLRADADAGGDLNAYSWRRKSHRAMKHGPQSDLEVVALRCTNHTILSLDRLQKSR